MYIYSLEFLLHIWERWSKFSLEIVSRSRPPIWKLSEFPPGVRMQFILYGHKSYLNEYPYLWERALSTSQSAIESSKMCCAEHNLSTPLSHSLVRSILIIHVSISICNSFKCIHLFLFLKTTKWYLMLLFSWLFTTNCGVNNLSTLKTSKIPEGSGQKHLNSDWGSLNSTLKMIPR